MARAPRRRNVALPVDRPALDAAAAGWAQGAADSARAHQHHARGCHRIDAAVADRRIRVVVTWGGFGDVLLELPICMREDKPAGGPADQPAAIGAGLHSDWS